MVQNYVNVKSITYIIPSNPYYLECFRSLCTSLITVIQRFIFIKYVFNLFKVKSLFNAFFKTFCSLLYCKNISKIKLLVWFDLKMY